MGKFENNMLLPHNKEAYLKVIEHFKNNNRAAVVHATGTGKSYIIAAVADKFPGKVIVLAPNYFVLDESRKLCSERIEFRTFASLMYDESPAGDYQLICIDEFHRAGAEEWGKGVARLLEANPNAKVLGTTATAIRYLDGQRNMVDELFDGNVVSSLSLREAIDRGIIQEPTYVASLYAFKETYSAIKEQIMASNKKSEEDKMKAMRTLNGIAHNWENAHGVSLVMRKYLHKDIKRVVVFCSKVAKAAKARDILGPWFAGAGFKHIRFYNIDYKEKNVKKEMEDFQMDNFDGIKVAISVNMLNEGVHVDGVDAIIMMRSTVSPNIILQQIGRCLTAKKTEHKPVILDLVNNMDTLGEMNLWAFTGTKIADGMRDDDNSMSKGFPFNIIDECRDIRTFLTQVQNEFDVVTDYYPLFWKFIEEKGRLPKYSVKEEKGLYEWCGQVWGNVRGLADRYPEVLAKLKEMRWGEEKERQNEKMYSAFWKFVNTHGRLPKRSVKEEKSLSQWCSTVGINKNRMAERYPDVLKKMEKLGYKRIEDKRSERTEEYRSFIAKHGRLPKKSVKEEKSLWSWCLALKNNKYGLGDRFPEIRKEIMSMGMTSYEDKTKKNIEILKTFIKENNRLPKWGIKEEKKLWNICQRFKLNSQGLADKYPEIVNLLNQYEWRSPAGKMNLAIESFRIFYKTMGRLPVPGVKEEKTLYQWCKRISDQKDVMRVKYPQLSDILDLLDTRPSKEDVEKGKYKELLDFLVENNRLPSRAFDKNEKLVNLYKRIVSNKNNLKEKYPEVYRKIIELGYISVEDKRNLNIENLVKFIEENGRLPKESVEKEKGLYYLCSRLSGNVYGLAEKFPEVLAIIKKMGWGNLKLTKRYAEFWKFFNDNNRLPKQSVKEEKSLYDWCGQVWRNDRNLAEKFPDVYAKIKEFKGQK